MNVELENPIQRGLAVGFTAFIDGKEVFHKTTWKNKNLSSISFAGLSTNVKDGMTWGLLAPSWVYIASGVMVGMPSKH